MRRWRTHAERKLFRACVVASTAGCAKSIGSYHSRGGRLLGFVSPNVLTGGSLGRRCTHVEQRAMDGWPPVPALNPETGESLRFVVWTDFQLAVLFFVLAPLILLGLGIWSSVSSKGERDETLRLVSGYWQCSSLLLITVLLNIGALQIGAVTGLAAQVMILISLWYWKDLTDILDAQDDVQATVVRAWRWVATLVAVAGTAANLPFLYCTTVPSLAADAGCAAWLEAPLTFRDLLLPGLSQEFSGQLGQLGLSIYVAYTIYFVFTILPSIGRRGLAKRPGFTWISPLEWLGLATPRDG